MNKLSMKIFASLVVVLAAAFVAALDSQGVASAQNAAQDDSEEVRKVKLDEEYPMISDDLWEAVVMGIKESSRLYYIADTLRVEKIQPLVDTWEPELGYELKIESVDFLECVMDWSDIELGKSSQWQGFGTLKDVEFMEYSFDDGGPEAYFFVIEIDSEGKELEYRVDTPRLKELSFKTALAFSIIHPLNTVISEFQSQGESLTSAISRLCEMAGVDYSFNYGKLSEIFITQKLRDKTIQECINNSCQVGGLMALYSGDEHVYDREIDYEDIYDLFKAREQSELGLEGEEPIKTPVDALKRLLKMKAQDMRENPTVVSTN